MSASEMRNGGESPSAPVRDNTRPRQAIEELRVVEALELIENFRKQLSALNLDLASLAATRGSDPKLSKAVADNRRRAILKRRNGGVCNIFGVICGLVALTSYGWRLDVPHVLIAVMIASLFVYLYYRWAGASIELAEVAQMAEKD